MDSQLELHIFNPYTTECEVRLQLPRGRGAGVGNVIRREVMVGANGFAVYAIKIKGATHQYDYVPGLIHQITEVIFNLKKLVIKGEPLLNNAIAIAKIDVQTTEKSERFDVTAADIRMPAGITIINSDQLICSLDAHAHFVMEIAIIYNSGIISQHDERYSSIVGSDFIVFDGYCNKDVLAVSSRVDEHSVTADIKDTVIISVKTTLALNATDELFKAIHSLKVLFEILSTKHHFVRRLIDDNSVRNFNRNQPNIQDIHLELIHLRDDGKLSKIAFDILTSHNIYTVQDLIKHTESDLHTKGLTGHIHEIRSILETHNTGLKQDIETLGKTASLNASSDETLLG